MAASWCLSEQNFMPPGYEADLSRVSINSFPHITQHLNEILSTASIRIPQGEAVRNLIYFTEPCVNQIQVFI